MHTDKRSKSEGFHPNTGAQDAAPKKNSILARFNQPTPHDPTNPKVSSEGTARSAPDGHGHSNPTGLPEAKGKDDPARAFRFNENRQNASNNFPDIKNAHGQISDATLNSAQGGLAGGAASLGGFDASIPSGHRLHALSENLAVSPDAYKGRAGTKEEKLDQRRTHLNAHRERLGDEHHNYEAVGDFQKNYAKISEKDQGHVHKEGAGSVSYAALASKVEDGKVHSNGSKTEWKGSAEALQARVGGEYQAKASKLPGQESLALHAKGEAEANLYKASGSAMHKFGRNFSVGGHAFSQAGAATSNEASLVADRPSKTLMGRFGHSAFAGLLNGGGANIKAGPFSADVTAAKLLGAGHFAAVGGGISDGVAQGMVDIGGAMGAGGRLRVGGGYDVVRGNEIGREAMNRMTNKDYSQEVHNRGTGATPEERGQFRRQQVEEMLEFEKHNGGSARPGLVNQTPDSNPLKNQNGRIGLDAPVNQTPTNHPLRNDAGRIDLTPRAPQLNTNIESGSLGLDFTK